jgi:hypothetical protein
MNKSNQVKIGLIRAAQRPTTTPFILIANMDAVAHSTLVENTDRVE